MRNNNLRRPHYAVGLIRAWAILGIGLLALSGIGCGHSNVKDKLLAWQNMELVPLLQNYEEPAMRKLVADKDILHHKPAMLLQIRQNVIPAYAILVKNFRSQHLQTTEVRQANQEWIAYTEQKQHAYELYAQYLETNDQRLRAEAKAAMEEAKQTKATANQHLNALNKKYDLEGVPRLGQQANE